MRGRKEKEEDDDGQDIQEADRKEKGQWVGKVLRPKCVCAC